MRAIRRVSALLILVFLLPAAATAAWWSAKERPASWRAADWSASGLLSDPAAAPDAAIYLMAARTGGLKGAFSVHSWIVLKKANGNGYDRYEKVGWGSPVRHNGYAPDARWYSNEPWIVHEVTGEKAARLIPRFEAAIERYPYRNRGDYHIWPGPNSNTFVAYLLNAVPEFGGRMPPNAVGRDFAPGAVSVDWRPESFDLHATIQGVIGFTLGLGSGIEVHVAGLVAGIDFTRPALKIPAYGRLELF